MLLLVYRICLIGQTGEVGQRMKETELNISSFQTLLTQTINKFSLFSC